jgi:hypothetical protein
MLAAPAFACQPQWKNRLSGGELVSISEIGTGCWDGHDEAGYRRSSKLLHERDGQIGPAGAGAAAHHPEPATEVCVRLNGVSPPRGK